MMHDETGNKSWDVQQNTDRRHKMTTLNDLSREAGWYDRRYNAMDARIKELEEERDRYRDGLQRILKHTSPITKQDIAKAALWENDGLTVSVKSGRLEISIGIDTLAWATENAPGPFFETDECENKWKVTDHAVWADSVVLALEKEEDDGTTLVHRMFDTAFEYAIEQGFEGIEEAEHGE